MSVATWIPWCATTGPVPDEGIARTTVQSGHLLPGAGAQGPGGDLTAALMVGVRLRVTMERLGHRFR
jgi:hypothetical protein